MTKQQRIALAAIAVVVAIAAFVVLKPSGDDQSADTAAQAVSSVGKSGDHAGHAGGHAPGGSRGGGKAVQLDATGDAGTTIQTKRNAPVGGITVLNAKVGDPVRFTVKSDTSDEIHVHGYDLKADVAPGKPAAFAFPAKIDGVFEIELENAGAQIARLTVAPR